jgi:hypothetical protein
VTLNLNPARLAYFTDWAKTLPPRPLPTARAGITEPVACHLPGAPQDGLLGSHPPTSP